MTKPVEIVATFAVESEISDTASIKHAFLEIITVSTMNSTDEFLLHGCNCCKNVTLILWMKPQ